MMETDDDNVEVIDTSVTDPAGYTVITNVFPQRSKAEMRLLKDLRAIQSVDESEMGFRAYPKDRQLFVWTVELFEFDRATQFKQDMLKYEQQTGRNYVEFTIYFPADYPDVAPFVHVVLPRFMPGTGFVRRGGSICTNLLMKEGWNQNFEAVTFLYSLILLILTNGPRIDFANTLPYSQKEAIRSHKKAARLDGWHTMYLPGGTETPQPQPIKAVPPKPPRRHHRHRRKIVPNENEQHLPFDDLFGRRLEFLQLN
jgi:ubiquitin-protein ligase